MTQDYHQYQPYFSHIVTGKLYWCQKCQKWRHKTITYHLCEVCHNPVDLETEYDIFHRNTSKAMKEQR